METDVHRVPIPVSLRDPDTARRVSLLLSTILAHIEDSPTNPSETRRTGYRTSLHMWQMLHPLCLLLSRFSCTSSCEDRTGF